MNIPKRNKQLCAGLEDMCKYLKAAGVKTVVEIGSWAGSSASIFAKHFDKITCIDPWKPTAGTISDKYTMTDVEAEFDKVKAQYRNIVKIKARVQDIELPDADVIYIDGEHTYQACKRDIKQALTKCNSFIAGHDYWQKKFPGVVKAVNEAFGRPDKTFRDSSWIVKI